MCFPSVRSIVLPAGVRLLPLALLLLLAPLARASDYYHGGGDYDDSTWTRGVPGDSDYAKDVGPPGSGDNAYVISDGTPLSVSDGSVNVIAVALPFDVSGTFHANTYIDSAGYLEGKGKVIANTIGGKNGAVDIRGGHLVGTNCPATATLAGGSLTVTSYTAPVLVLRNGSEATIADPLTHFRANVSGGSTLRVPGVVNAIDDDFTLEDAGSAITVTGNYQAKGGYLDVEAGTFKVEGKLVLDGGVDADGNDVEGGGAFNGKDTLVSVADLFLIGNSRPGGYVLAIGKGAEVSCNEVIIAGDPKGHGTVQMDGAGTVWHVAKSLAVGESGTGDLQMSAGAQVQLGSGTLLAVGNSSGSRGSVEMDGRGTIFDARGALTNIGQDVDTIGNVVLGNGAALLLGQSTFVGDQGNGGLNVSGGSQVTIIGSRGKDVQFGVGNASSGFGSFSVQGAGSRLTAGRYVLAIIGADGSGFGGVGTGGTVQTDTLALGAVNGATGNIVIDGAGSTWTNADNLVVGDVTPRGTNGGTGIITLSNGGAMRTGANARSFCHLAPGGQIVLDAKSRFVVGSGAYGPAGTLFVSSGGILSGQGKRQGSSVVGANVVGKVVIGAGGRFKPGGDPNVFSIKGDCELANGAETDLEIGGTGTAGVAYDQLAVSGKATLGGTLRLVLLSGYRPKVGDKLAVIKAGTMTGAFSSVVSPGLGLSQAASGGGLSVTVTSVSAHSAPQIDSRAAATAVVGVPFTYQITASNDPAGFTAGGLPAGLEVDSATGLISGTPQAAGKSNVTLGATNAAGTDTEALALTVDADSPNGAPLIDSATSVSGTVGEDFRYQIEATNSPTKYTASGLPAGLGLSVSSGLIVGKPKTSGTFTVTLGATNAHGTGTATLTLKISAATAATPPVVTVAANGSGSKVEGTGKIKVVFRRTGGTGEALTVRYKLKGSAKPGADYQPLSGSLTIPAGASQAKLRVRPINNTTEDGTRTLKLKLVPSADDVYTVGTPGQAKLKILDND